MKSMHRDSRDIVLPFLECCVGITTWILILDFVDLHILREMDTRRSGPAGNLYSNTYDKKHT